MKTMAEIKKEIVRTREIDSRKKIPHGAYALLGFDKHSRCIYRRLVNIDGTGYSKAMEYDENNNMIHTIFHKIESDNGIVEELMGYDEFGRVTYYTKIESRKDDVTETYEYDEFGRLVLRKNFLYNKMVSMQEFRYDENDRIKFEIDSDKHGAITKEWEYYDKYSVCNYHNINTKEYYIDTVLVYRRVATEDEWRNECGGVAYRQTDNINGIKMQSTIKLCGGITIEEVNEINKIIGIE